MNFTFKRGDSFIAECTRKDDDGLPVDITNTTILSQPNGCRRALPFMQVIKTNAAAGEFSLISPAEDTATWPLGILEWDIQYQDGDFISSQPGNRNIYITVIEGATDAD